MRKIKSMIGLHHFAAVLPLALAATLTDTASATPTVDAKIWLVQSGAPVQSGRIHVFNTSDKEASVQIYGSSAAPTKIAPGTGWSSSFTSLPIIFSTERVYVAAAATAISTPTSGGAGYSPVTYNVWLPLEAVPVDCSIPDAFRYVCGLTSNREPPVKKGRPPLSKERG